MRHRTNTLARLTHLALAATIPMMFLIAAPAEAHSKWRVGTTFSVGHFDFSVYFRPGHYRDFYFRVAEPLRYSGYSCNDRCYLDRGHTYHHAECSVVHHHFRRYRFSPLRILDALFSSTYPSHRHDHYGHHDRYDRYDRYRYDNRYDRYDRDRYRKYDRYDRRHKYDRYGDRYDRRRGRYDDRYDR